MSEYTRWYTTGSVNPTNGSRELTGTGTYWSTAGLNPGDMITFDNGNSFKEIASINGDTSITLAQAYSGATATGQSYAIVRNFTATMPAKVAAQTAELLGDFQKYIETDMQKINGKSAYEIAKANGYTGTEAEWLESLKGAGEYTTLLNATEPYRYNNAGAHNAHYRGKYLGEALTDAQSSAIRNGTFADLFPGDYWRITTNGYKWTDGEGEEHEASTTVTYRIAGCDYYFATGNEWGGLATHHLVLVPDSVLYPARMNATDTTVGAYVGSEMYTEHLKRAKALITAAFGEEHILTHREYLQNAVVDGRPSGGMWVDSTVELMTEQMVYGGRVYGVANDGGDILPIVQTISKSQLPLFQHSPYYITTPAGSFYWLRDVANGACFACSNNYPGLVAALPASTTAWGVGVRPAFLVY